MPDWKDYLQYFKDFFDTLAGKLTAILAFALLVIIALGWFGASIPPDYKGLVYIVVILAMLIFAGQAIAQVWEKHRSQAAKSQPVAAPTPLPTAPATFAPPLDSLNARERYLRAVMDDSRALRLVGLDPQAADPSRGGLTLEALYVSLDTTTSVEVDEEKGSRRKAKQQESEEARLLAFGREKTHPLSALEALSDNPDRRMVLLGLPGTGKSTFARYLALRMAQAEFDRSKNITDLLPGWQGGALLPLVISLGRMAETIPADCKKGRAELIENYVTGLLKADERTRDFASHLLTALQQSGGLVLFDGLDEVADLKLRPLVVQSVEDFAQKYGKNPASRFLLTCRTYSYRHDSRWQLTGWPTHELALLDEEKIKRFVQAWHEEHARIEPARRADFERKREALLLSLQPDDRRRLHEIAPFPIILTMMAVVHTHYGELPDTRAQVYEKCVDLLLVRWEVERPVSGRGSENQKRTIIDALGIPRVMLDRALWEIAFKAHEGREDGDGQRGPALVTEDLLTGILNAHLNDLDKVKLFLDYCQSSNGLLMLQGTVSVAGAPEGTPPRRVYAFPHLTFEEYLAARHLVIRTNFGKTTRELVMHSDRWREVGLLMGEHLCFAQGDQERMDTLVGSLQAKTANKDGDWRAAWLAGDLLTLYQRAFPNEKSPHEEGTKAGLLELVHTCALEPLSRAAAADALDELGYLPPDLYAFVPVAQDNILRYFAKYPVTNAQYARFLNVENFSSKSLWTGFPKYAEPEKNYKKIGDWGNEGWDWLQKALKDEDFQERYDIDVENGVVIPRYWQNGRFGAMRSNAPVVGISWHEANAYCKWLLQNWDELDEGRQGLAKPAGIRLPTEPEWVLAAGGEANNRFAFGELKDLEDLPRYANTRESGINRTTPVWMYPKGISPNKVMDMSGNVFEWQANYYDENQYPAWRGGCWDLNLDYARVSFRFRYVPVNRYYGLGFRVVLAPHP